MVIETLNDAVSDIFIATLFFRLFFEEMERFLICGFRRKNVVPGSLLLSPFYHCKTVPFWGAL